MKQDYYRGWIISSDMQDYTFASIGKNGKILKRVEFRPMPYNWYNLAFGDISEKMVIDDFVVTNNMDTSKVLTTVFQIVRYYLKIFHDRIIYFSGSTDSRMRLYRMAISKYKKELMEIFNIFGITQTGEVVLFTENINYIYILVSLKSKP